MKHIFIINPHAGKRDSRQRIYDMADVLRDKYDLDVQCILTRKQGHATEIARNLCQTGEELRFYACGGDGTINEVANGILGFDNAAMTCIPIGTGNDFLRNFGEDAPKFADAENLWDGPQFPLDVIDVGGRVALTIACSGIDARIGRDVHKYSETPFLDGKSSYVVSLIVNFIFKNLASHWTVELDGEAVEGDYAVVSVCNGRYYGGGMNATPDQNRLDPTGKLSVMLFYGKGRLATLIAFPSIFEGKHIQKKKMVAIHEGYDIRVVFDAPRAVQIDGETITGVTEYRAYAASRAAEHTSAEAVVEA